MRFAKTLGIVIFVVLVLGMLGGCATTKPIWFIATPGYVDSRIASSEEAMRREYEAQLAEKDRQIARLETELRAQQEVADELAGLTDVISEIENSNRELRGLASEVELRMDALPRETIQELIDALQRYLELSPEE